MSQRSWIRNAVIGTVAAGTLMMAGAVLATSGITLAQSNGSSSGVTAAQTAGTPADERPAGPHTVGSCTEAAQSGATADKIKAAALASVPNATIERIETDCDTGSPYEVHLTKQDGTRATAYVNKDFKVTSVQDGMGPGGPHGRRGAQPTA